MSEYFKNIKKTFKLKNNWIYFIFIPFIIVTACLNNEFKRSTIFLFESIGYTLIGAVSLSLVVGFLGELSLGHAAFMSIGAIIGMYSQQIFFPSLASENPLISLILAIIIGAIVAGIFGFIIGLPALRLKGDYLAIVTLAFGEIVKSVFQNIDAFGGALGFTNNFRYNYRSLYIIIFVVALICIIISKNLIKSKHGRAITAIRDNEIAAKAMGVNDVYYKLLVFVISAMMAGVAGVLYGASSNLIQSATFNYNYSINNMLVIVVIGGMGNLNGSIISAIAITWLNTKLQVSLTGNLAALKNIIYALVLIVVVIYNNAPTFKTFREKYNLQKLLNYITNHIIKRPDKQEAIQKDFGADWSIVPTKIPMDTIVTTDIMSSPEVDEEKGGAKDE